PNPFNRRRAQCGGGGTGPLTSGRHKWLYLAAAAQVADTVPRTARAIEVDGHPNSTAKQVHWGWIAAIVTSVLTIGYVGVSNFDVRVRWRGPSAAIPGPSVRQPAAIAADKNRQQSSQRPPGADLDAFKAELDDISRSFEGAQTED